MPIAVRCLIGRSGRERESSKAGVRVQSDLGADVEDALAIAEGAEI